jgi:ribosomal protein S28E/S33
MELDGRLKRVEVLIMELQVRDRVLIINTNGNPVAKGTIVNINEFREPSQMYAVDVDGYEADVLFFGKSQLVKGDVNNE